MAGKPGRFMSPPPEVDEAIISRLEPSTIGGIVNGPKSLLLAA
jgi:hypothetical protein